MPESKQVREAARALAKQRGWKCWWDHRDEVLPEVYAQLGLPRYTAKSSKKRKREQKKPRCSVCWEESAELLTLAPCGHQCICAGCRVQLGQCPLCRTTIVSTVQKVYAL